MATNSHGSRRAQARAPHHEDKEIAMDLYFSPLACSMATRIAFYEAGADANYLEVDPLTKRVQHDGSDFFQRQPARPGADAAHG
jgi:hypothetical protein